MNRNRLLSLPVLLAALAAPAMAAPSVADLAGYFQGTWDCSGHFASGKPIASTEQFRTILGGKWLLEVHTDKPPHHYDAYSIWGIDAQTHGFSTVIHDSFGGLRTFHVLFPDDGTIRLQRSTAHGGREAFVFAKHDPGTFRITYRHAKADGPLKTGDTLTCRKRSR